MPTDRRVPPRPPWAFLLVGAVFAVFGLIRLATDSSRSPWGSFAVAAISIGGGIYLAIKRRSLT